MRASSLAIEHHVSIDADRGIDDEDPAVDLNEVDRALRPATAIRSLDESGILS